LKNSFEGLLVTNSICNSLIFRSTNTPKFAKTTVLVPFSTATGVYASDSGKERGTAILCQSSSKTLQQSLYPRDVFRTCTTAVMVFQFRIVAGTLNNLSIWPRYPMVFMWRRYIPKTNCPSNAITRTNHSPSDGNVTGSDTRTPPGFDRIPTNLTIFGDDG